MTRRRRAASAAATTLLVAAAVLVGAGPVAAQEAPTSADDLPRPTPDQLSGSVRVWEPNGVRGWDPSGSVAQLETQEQDGEETVVTLSSDILFAFDSGQVPPAAPSRIVALVADLPQGADVSVTGHTDSLGADAYNRALSQRRARAVAEVIADGRADLLLTVEGAGASEPVAAETSGGEDDPEGRARNRRVEIRYRG